MEVVDFKLPTFIPNDIQNIRISKRYFGPTDLTLDTEEQMNENPQYVYPVLEYILVHNGEEEKIPFIVDMTFGTLDSWSFYSPELLINISDEVEGIYYFDGSTQVLSWEDGEYLYTITALYEKEIVEELIAKEEFIKIAQSFEKY